MTTTTLPDTDRYHRQLTRGVTVSLGLRDNVGPADWDALIGLGDRAAFCPEAAMIHQGAEVSSVFILLEGTAKVCVDNPEGRSLTLAVLGPGHLVGDFEALDVSATAPVSVVALEPVVCRRIPAERFMTFMHTRPRVAVALAKALAARLAAADRRRSAAASSDLPRELAAYLVELSQHVPEDPPRIDLTQDELAGLMSTSRDSTVRALGKLRALGLVTTQRRSILLTSPDGLVRYAANHGL